MGFGKQVEYRSKTFCSMVAADLRAVTGAMIHLNMIPLSGKIGRYHQLEPIIPLPLWLRVDLATCFARKDRTDCYPCSKH